MRGVFKRSAPAPDPRPVRRVYVVGADAAAERTVRRALDRLALDLDALGCDLSLGCDGADAVRRWARERGVLCNSFLALPRWGDLGTSIRDGRALREFAPGSVLAFRACPVARACARKAANQGKPVLWGAEVAAAPPRPAAVPA